VVALVVVRLKIKKEKKSNSFISFVYFRFANWLAEGLHTRTTLPNRVRTSFFL